MTANRSLSSSRVRRVIALPAAIFLVTAIVVAGSSFVFAKTKTKTKTATKPDKAALVKKKATLQADIDLTDALLKQTRRNKTLSLAQLVALNKKIEAREALITEIQNEVNDLQDQIDENNVNIARLDTDIARMKRDYSRMIIFAYKNRNPEQRMMFLFASNNFNQAYLRMRYMQQVGEDRKKYAEDIAAQQLVLNENLQTLQAQKADKEALLGTNESEHQTLAAEKNDKDKTLLELKSKEQTLKDDLAKKKKEKADIDAAIQKLIAEEAARLAAAATTTTTTTVVKPKTSTTTTTTTSTSTTVNTTVATPDATLSSSFSTSQGALPWPVAQGSITSHFGKQEHPVLKGVYVNNNGIDIATTSGSSARAVFDGEVTGVTNIEGSGWLVIVRHGEYLSVYAQLESVSVKQGDKVKTKDVIGKISTDDVEGTVLHFEVWKTGTGKLDPEKWLATSH